MPEGGGYYDQDAGLMIRMTLAENVYNAVTSWQNKTGKAIHSLTVQERRVIRELRDQGYL